jgi:phosphoglycolate phosphatase-like HAD superfamily hydrolase
MNHAGVSTILLFDIDGTLCLSGGAGIAGIALAFEQIFGLPAQVEGISMAGRTDAWCLSALAAASGVSPTEEQAERFRAEYLKHLVVEIEKPRARKGIMPGVRSLLDVLVERKDMHLALLTGNYERTARAKLEYFDLWRYFDGGAFGDRAEDRNHLFDEAVAAVAARRGGSVSDAGVVVIGDTPLDVACARHGGGRALAVATGSHKSADLLAAGADSVFEDLTDTMAVVSELERLGRPGR